MIKDKDKILLLELLKKGRASFSELSQHSHMSRQGVFSRMKSLKNEGVIRNFTVNIDSNKLGLILKAYILIEAEPIKHLRAKAEDILKTFPQISQIHRLFGRFDILLEVLVKNTDELSELVKKIHELDVVTRTETLIVYREIKCRPEHPIEKVLSEKS